MFWRCLWKNIDFDVFDDVWKNPKHRANDASNDVNRPPLLDEEDLGRYYDDLEDEFEREEEDWCDLS